MFTRKKLPWPLRRLTGPVRRFRHQVTLKLFGEPSTFTFRLKDLLRVKQSTGIWSQLSVRDLPSKERSTQREHYGPKARLPDLFQRRDQIYLALEAQRLQWHVPPPVIYHDLLDAAARVGRIEERIGYTFNDKMLCIEALKVTSSVTPLYFKGVVHQVDRNHRIALLGDRVLSLALCEIWFQTGNTTKDYSKMSIGSESRAVLCARGRTVGIDKNLLLDQWQDTCSDDQVAETFEAILGAIYLDSAKNIETVKRVLTQAELDQHKLLKADAQSQDAQERKELEALRNAELARQRQLANLRKAESTRSARAVAVEARQQVRAAVAAKKQAAAVRRQAAEQTKRQMQESDSTTKAQKQNASSETAQTQTRSEDNTAHTHGVASVNLAEAFIKQKRAMEKNRSARKDKEKSQVADEQAPSENRDQAQDPKTQRRAVEAVSKIPEKGSPLSDVSEYDGTTPDSGRQRSLVSRLKDQGKVDDSVQLDNQDLQTPLPMEVTISKAEDQSREEDPENTAATEDPLLLGEDITGMSRREIFARTRAWKSAVEQSKKMKEQGLDETISDPFRIYAERLQNWGWVTPEGRAISAREGRAIKASKKRAARIAERAASGETKTHQEDPAGLPTSITVQREESIANGSDKADTVTSPVPAPVPDQKLSSSLEVPGPAESASVANKDPNNPSQELSSSVEETDSANASNIVMHDIKAAQVHTNDIEQLEKDIVDSHKNIWQPAEGPHSIRQRKKRIASTRRSLRNSQILEQQLSGGSRPDHPVTLEEDTEANKKQLGINGKPFARFDYYESAIERFMANVTQDDSAASDTPRSKSEKEPEFDASIIRRTTRRRQ